MGFGKVEELEVEVESQVGDRCKMMDDLEVSEWQEISIELTGNSRLRIFRQCNGRMDGKDKSEVLS